LNSYGSKKYPGLLVVVSAPSGAGKTSICRKLMEMFPEIRFSVSYTTRSPRPGEASGKDYNFVTADEFREMIDRGEFVEWVENYGDFYGTSRKTMDAFLEKGFNLLLDIEPRGAKEVKKQYPQGIFVFILPPSLSELKSRLAKRGENEEMMGRRLGVSLDEIREAMWYDYIIFNENLEDAVDRFRAVYIAELSRREHFTEKIESFFKL
jgi:guanylate kinase